MRPSFSIKITFCDHAKALKNKQYGSPHRCLIEAFILLTFGDVNLGESFLVKETFGMKQSLPSQKATSWGTHQEGSCESGILTTLLSSTLPTTRLSAVLLRGRTWVRQTGHLAPWASGLGSRHQEQPGWDWPGLRLGDPTTRWMLSFLKNAKSTCIVAIARLSCMEEISMKASPKITKLKSLKRCPKLTKTDCFMQIQGWWWCLKTRLSFSPDGFLSDFLLYKYFHNVPICPNISPCECYIVLRPCNRQSFHQGRFFLLMCLRLFLIYVRGNRVVQLMFQHVKGLLGHKNNRTFICT